jgi:HD superfamily phosphohydrolase
MQRLRELRSNNIHSLCFTGGANINRYEHSVGTCYLALRCIECNYKDISSKEKQLIVLAALFHDLYNAAFGHSLEYVEDFSPENLFYFAATGKRYDKYEYKHAYFEPIYFGMCQELTRKLIDQLKLNEEDIKTIGEYICGKGEYGPLLSGSMDLDNIDNVYRMSYHMGLTNDKQTPLKLAQSIWTQNRNLYIKKESLPLVNGWVKLRKQLYTFLLLNPDDFSAKYMLTEAIDLSKVNAKPQFAWYDTDFQLLEKLSRTSSDVSFVISRLMKASLYGCIGIYSTSNTKLFRDFLNFSTRSSIEKQLNLIFKPEITAKVPDFGTNEQKAIKGIKGIAYDPQTSNLKLTHEVREETIRLLVKKELLKHKKIIGEIYSELHKTLFPFKLQSPIFGIYSILDIDKTGRKVSLNLASGESIEFGYSSNRLYIGVFIKNKEFANFDPSSNKLLNNGNLSNIKRKIRDFLADLCNDGNIEEIPLYSEVECG